MHMYDYTLPFREGEGLGGKFGSNWSRLVNGAWRYSIIDHVYTTDETLITRVEPIEVLTGDHWLVLLTIDETKIEAEKSIRRDWRNYTKDKLINEISKYDWHKSFEMI